LKDKSGEHSAWDYGKIVIKRKQQMLARTRVGKQILLIMYVSVATMEINIEVPQKTKNRTSIWSC
jgi:hypothetical protein